MADDWLQANIAPLLASPDFNTAGGGHVPWVAVGPDVDMGYLPSGSLIPVTWYQHESTCRFMLKLAGASVFPGACATAPDMNEFQGN